MRLLDALRRGTTAQHQRLDQEISRYPLTSIDGYRRFLSMQASIIPPVECWLRHQPLYRTLPDCQQRLRTDALLDDLARFDMAAPAAAELSFLTTDASVAGICYVLEGSRLGGAYLRSLLYKSAADFPHAFLSHGQGESYWKSFWHGLPSKMMPRRRKQARPPPPGIFLRLT